MNLYVCVVRCASCITDSLAEHQHACRANRKGNVGTSDLILRLCIDRVCLLLSCKEICSVELKGCSHSSPTGAPQQQGNHSRWLRTRRRSGYAGYAYFSRFPCLPTAREPQAGPTMFAIEGDQWKSHRVALAGPFNGAALESLIPAIVERAQALVDAWRRRPSRVVRIDKEMVGLTVDVILTRILGRHLDATDKDPHGIIAMYSSVRVHRASPSLGLVPDE